MLRPFSILGLLLLLSVGPALAEGVTLEEAVRSAVTRRPMVKVSEARAEAAQAAAGEVRGGYLPQVSVQETFTRTNEPGSSLFISLNQQQLVLSPTADAYNFPPTRSDFETRFQLDQVLFDARLAHAIRQAQSSADAARASARWSREEAAFTAFVSYLGVQRAQAAHNWAQSSLEEAGELLRLADLRQRNGIGLKSDTLRARVYEAEAERRHLRAGNDVILARRRLALAMGESGGEAEIESPLAPGLFGDAPVDEVARADLEALDRSSVAARRQLSSARAGWLPSLGVSASYSGHDPDAPGFDADSWMVNGRLSWTLFDGLRREQGQKRAAAELRAASQRLQEARREAELALQEAKLRAEEAQLQFQTAQRAVSEAEESHHLLRERYAAGLSDLSDLLGVQSALDRARADLVEAEAGLVMARGNIYFQGGGFLAQVLPGEVQ